MMNQTQKQRIFLFLILAFGISWLTALIIYLTGGLTNSPIIAIENSEISLAYILLATTYMFGPAIANILTRIITHEGKTSLGLRPRFEGRRWVFYLLAWFVPGLCTLIGAAVFFLIFPDYFDPGLSALAQQLKSSGQAPNINPWFIVVLQILQAMVISPLLNTFTTFGEEFGWRAYLQPKLMHLGPRKAILLTGLIWGAWHWPIILMGYNYGFDYFGAPFLGLLAMVWFTLNLSVILGWMTIKSDNVWPAAIAHGAINGIAAIGLLLIQGSPSTLLGPTPVGMIGGVGVTIAALILLILPGSFKKENLRN
jgi:membrane protease YdiL (CAAX protease family)